MPVAKLLLLFSLVLQKVIWNSFNAERGSSNRALPKSPVVLSAYGWMIDHFHVVGDYQPHLGGDIHLEPRYIKEVHHKYINDLTNVDVEQYLWSNLRLWVHCILYVVMRE